jgi:hypothetical protein
VLSDKSKSPENAKFVTGIVTNVPTPRDIVPSVLPTELMNQPVSAQMEPTKLTDKVLAQLVTHNVLNAKTPHPTV